MYEMRGVRFEAVLFKKTPGEACLRLEGWTRKEATYPL